MPLDNFSKCPDIISYYGWKARRNTGAIPDCSEQETIRSVSEKPKYSFLQDHYPFPSSISIEPRIADPAGIIAFNKFLDGVELRADGSMVRQPRLGAEPAQLPKQRTALEILMGWKLHGLQPPLYAQQPGFDLPASNRNFPLKKKSFHLIPDPTSNLFGEERISSNKYQPKPFVGADMPGWGWKGAPLGQYGWQQEPAQGFGSVDTLGMEIKAALAAQDTIEKWFSKNRGARLGTFPLVPSPQDLLAAEVAAWEAKIALDQLWGSVVPSVGLKDLDAWTESLEKKRDRTRPDSLLLEIPQTHILLENSSKKDITSKYSNIIKPQEKYPESDNSYRPHRSSF